MEIKIQETQELLEKRRIIPESAINMRDCEKFWNDIFNEKTENVHEGLIRKEKDIVKKETGWSDEIIDSIGSMKEYIIYKEAKLVEGEVNEKKCLMRMDVDWDQKDEFGETNRERIAEGYSPIDKSGDRIHLHHIGQHADSPLAELTYKEHRLDGNDAILHDKSIKTEVHGEGNKWSSEKIQYWKNRPIDGGKSNE